MMKVKICNDVWKVKLVNADAKKMNPDEDHYNLGLTEYLKCQINIREGLPETIARATVIHELVHAFLFSYGHTVENEEAMCGFFGSHADEIMEITDQVMKEVFRC